MSETQAGQGLAVNLSDFQVARLSMTEDGSPTLTLGTDELNESMHNRVGAFSETQEIYLGAFRLLANYEFPVNALVYGLGLGYIEVSLIGQQLRENAPSLANIDSYESVRELREHFYDFYHGTREIPAWYVDAQTKICDLVAAKYHVQSAELKKQVGVWLETDRLQLHSELNAKTNHPREYHFIAFDAFSAKQDQDAWQEEFLSSWLKRTAAPTTVLATYAATGSLSRSLKANEFEVKKQPGFGGKRESTWAMRGSL